MRVYLHYIRSLRKNSKASIFFWKKKKEKVTEENQQMGSIPCAAVSILCKSFIESIVLYMDQHKKQLDTYMDIKSNKEGELELLLDPPNIDLLHVHRYAIEQMFIIGLQSVAEEYPLEIELAIDRK